MPIAFKLLVLEFNDSAKVYTNIKFKIKTLLY